MKAFLDNAGNGVYNNHYVDFSMFENLPSVGDLNSPVIANLATGGERVFHVQMTDPHDSQQIINVDLYAKAFFMPLKFLIFSPITEYRIKAYRWDDPQTKYTGRSEISFNEALASVKSKIFQNFNDA